MGSIRKKSTYSLSKARKSLWDYIKRQKPYKYLNEFFRIIGKIQPFFSIFVALLVSVPMIFAVTNSIDKYEAIHDNTIYREGIIGTFSNIDPLPVSPVDKPFSQINRDIVRLLFDPLFTTDSAGNLVGVLTDSYDVKDNGTKYTIHLKDRFWSNGNPVTANDVKATLDTIKKNGSSGLFYAAIENIDASAEDNKTVTFSLKNPNASFLETLYWPILPASVLSVNYDDLISDKFGTNPISNTDWSIDQITSDFVKLKNKKINKEIEFDFYSDTTELDKALNAGKIDGYYSLSMGKDKVYENNYKYELPRQLYSLYFNVSDTGNAFLKDPNLRKAIAYAIDRKEVVEDAGVVRDSLIQNDSWAFNPAVDTYQYNLDKSKKLLNDNGYKMDGENLTLNGKNVEFNLSIPETAQRIKQANKIADQLKVIGIKVNVKTIKDIQFVENVLSGNIFYKSIVLPKNYDAMIFSVESNLDPDKFSQWYSNEDDKNNINLNFSGYSDVRVDAYLRQGRNQLDKTLRKQPYMQFQKVFYDDCPIVTLYNPYLFYTTSKKIKNVDFTGAIRIEDRFMNFDKWQF